MHREKGQVDADHRHPEVKLAQALVIHVASPFGQPVIDRCHRAEDGARVEHIVEVRYHEIGIVVLEISRHQGQHQPGESTDGEHDDEADGKQHGCLESDGARPHGRHPIEHFHPGGHSNQHRCVHEKQLGSQGHASGEHVVSPDHKGQDRDRYSGIHHRVITEQLLARESGDDLRGDAEARQDQDVDLRMPEEPENMLEQDRVAAACCFKKAGAEMTVGEHHRDYSGQHRHHHDQQESRDQPGPDEQGHLHQGHTRRSQVENGDDDVDRPQYGRDAHHVNGENKKVGTGGAISGRQGRIKGPAEIGRATFHEQRGQH